jgi:hypothetical protein
MGSMRPGPYFSTWGPTDGPIRYRDRPPALGLVADPAEPPMPVGIAYPAGWIPDPKGRPPAATFRLEIGQVALPGWYVGVGRRFVPAAEWGRGCDRGPFVSPRLAFRSFHNRRL